MLRFIFPTLLVLITGAVHAEPSLSIDDVIERALQNHPDLEEIAEREKALEQNIRIAGAWPDARLSAEYSNMPLLKPFPGNHPMSGLQIKASQTLPFFGKVKAQKDAAAMALLSSAPERLEVRNQVAGHIHSRAVDWQLAHALKTITTRHIDALSELIGAIRARYELGRAEQYELIRMEVLREKLRDDLQELQKRTDTEAAAIAALAPGTTASSIRFGEHQFHNDTTIKSNSISVDALLAEALQKRPLYAVLNARVKGKEAKANAQRLGVLPDVTPWVGYRVRLPSGLDEGDNFFSLGFSLPLAWSSRSNKWNASAKQNKAQAQVLLAQSRSLTLSLRETLNELVIKKKRAEERHRTYRKVLLPGAAKTLSATLSAYQVNRAGFAELFSAELTTFEFERTAINALAESAKIDVQISTLVGRYAASSTSPKGSAP